MNSRDWEILVEYGDIFKKFLEKTRFSYQISLSEWKAKWQEEKVYNIMEGIDEIIKSIDNVPKAMQKYQDDKEEKKLQKKEK